METVSSKDLNSPEEFDLIWHNRLGDTFATRKLYIYEELSLKYIKEHSSILEIGCGDGYFLRHIRSYIKNTTVYGIDSSRVAIDYANNIYNVPCEVLDFKNLNYFKTYDVVMCHQTIEHLQNPEELINVCIKLLNEGGILIISSVTSAFNYDRMHLWSFSEEDFKGYFSKLKNVNIELLDVTSRSKSIIVGIGIK